MKSRRLYILVLCMVVVGLVAGTSCSGEESTATETPKPTPTVQAQTVKITCTTPVGHYLTVRLEQFANTIAERSGGRLETEFYPAGTLYNDAETVDVVPANLVQIAHINEGMWAGKVPGLDVQPLRGWFSSPEHYWLWMDKYGTDFFDQQISKANAKLLADFYYYNVMPLMTNKRISGQDDLKGMKIYAFSGGGQAVVDALGASSTIVEVKDIYPGMERGLLDGVIFPVNSLYPRKFYEVADYLTMWCAAPGGMWIVANLDWFSGLSADLQEIVMEEARGLQDFARQQSLQNFKLFVKLLEAEGVEVYELPQSEKDAWTEITREVSERLFRQDFGDATADQVLAQIEETRIGD